MELRILVQVRGQQFVRMSKFHVLVCLLKFHHRLLVFYQRWLSLLTFLSFGSHRYCEEAVAEFCLEQHFHVATTKGRNERTVGLPRACARPLTNSL